MVRTGTNHSERYVGVCLSPALIDHFDVANSIVVVIDILRATTSMCVALDSGARSVTPVLEVDACRAYRDKGYLIAAERNGEMIPGFDMGNSPFSFMEERIKDRDIAMTTTNGTMAINAAVERNAKEILIGAFANKSALLRYLHQRKENVLLLCAGYKNRPNLEDTIYAGALVRQLRPQFELEEDTTLIAETLFKMANRRKRYFLINSSHYHRVANVLKIQRDVKYCLRLDTHPVIPILKDGKLLPLKATAEA